jgi:hypothetical protein
MAEGLKLELPADNKLANQVAFIDYITESVWSPGRNIETESVSGAKQQNYYHLIKFLSFWIFSE